MSFTSETRIRLVGANESSSRALRNNNIGGWLVERFWLVKGTRGEGYFVEISSHITEAAAEKAKIKLDKKISKG